MKLFDTHAHFSSDPLQVAQVMANAQQAGVERIVAVGGSATLNSAALAAARAYPATILPALGFDRDQATCAPPESHIETLRLLAREQALAAIGETGLDFHYQAQSAELQCQLFAAHLTLADELRLPVIIHTREADEATLEVLDQTPWHGQGIRGVVHCFTGSREFAAQLLQRSLMISFSGILSFNNASALRACAATIPAEKLLIETDSPYLAPVPMRGQRNQPAFLTHVAACLARTRSTTVEEIAALTTANAARLFTPIRD